MGYFSERTLEPSPLEIQTLAKSSQVWGFGCCATAVNKMLAKGDEGWKWEPMEQGRVGATLLGEITHVNVVKLVNVDTNHADMSLYLAFDYA
ncbi:hypothetical protein JHK86_043356 [Glycine max]|nr:hypothetical protein JHK86_043356 [Glycine max]